MPEGAFDQWAAQAASSGAAQAAPASSAPSPFEQWVGQSVTGLEPEEYLKRSQAAGLSVNRPVEEHEQILREQGYAPEAVQALAGEYRLGQTRKEYQGTTPGGTLEQFARNSIPFSDLWDQKGHRTYYEATQRYKAGDSSPEVLDTIARYERLQEIDSDMANRKGSHGWGTGAALLQALGSIPKIAGEAWAGGKALSFAGKFVPGSVGRVMTGSTKFPQLTGPLAKHESTFLKTVSNHAGRMAILTTLMPSMYLEEARQRNLEAGRHPDDPEGLPGSILHGYANMLVLGSLQKNMGGRTFLGRNVKKGVVGLGEQIGVDAAGGLWDEVAPEVWKTKTRYGIAGNIARGEYGEALHHGIVTAVTFAAFAGLHDRGRKPSAARIRRAERDAATRERVLAEMGRVQEALDRMEKDGLKPEEAAERLTKEYEQKTKTLIEGDDLLMNRMREPADLSPVEAGNRARAESIARGENESTAEWKARRAATIAEQLHNQRLQGPPRPEPEMQTQVPTRAPWEEMLSRHGKDAPLTDADVDLIARNTSGFVVQDGKATPALKSGLRFPRKLTLEEYRKVDARRQELESSTQVPAKAPKVTQQAPTIAPEASVPPPQEGTGKPPIVSPDAPGEAGGPSQAVKPPPQGPQGGSGVSEKPTVPIHEPGTLPAIRQVIETAKVSPHIDMKAAGEMQGALRQAFDSMPDSVKLAVGKVLNGVEFYKDNFDLTSEILLREYENPATSPERQKELETLLVQLSTDSSTYKGIWYGAGWYNGVLYLDGKAVNPKALSGKHGSGEFDLVNVYAHEMGHAADSALGVDGTKIGGRLSESPAFLQAWQTDIVPPGVDGKPRLTEYATTNSVEGFAEFFRLLHGSKIPTAQIEAEFKASSAFFKANGLWPKERGLGAKGVKKGKLDEAFDTDKKVTLNPKTGEHVDQGPPKEAQAEPQVPTRAPEKPVSEMTESEKKAAIDDIAAGQDVFVPEEGQKKKRVQGSRVKRADSLRLSDDHMTNLRDMVPEVRRRNVLATMLQGGGFTDAGRRIGVTPQRAHQIFNEAMESLGLPAGRQGLSRLQELIAPDLAEAEASNFAAVMESIEGKTRSAEEIAAERESPGRAEDVTRITEVPEPEEPRYVRGRLRDRMQYEDPREPDAMRTTRETPLTEEERLLLESVNEDPQDATRRLALGDAIEEGGRQDDSVRARREVTDPPGERGVSDWRQLSREQINRVMETPEFRKIQKEWQDQMRKEHGLFHGKVIHQDVLLDRYFAEREAAGERLEFKLPEDPDPTDMTPVPSTYYGPKLYQTMYASDALEFVDPMGDMRFPQSAFWVSSNPKGPAPDRANRTTLVEYYTEAMDGGGGAPRVLIDRSPPEVGRYEKGLLDGTLTNLDGFAETNRDNVMRRAILSITVKPGGVGWAGHENWKIIDRLEKAGWRRVNLPDKSLRLDSPLKQRLRREQSLGLRTGEKFDDLPGAHAGTSRPPEALPTLSEVAEKVGMGRDRQKELKGFFRRLLTGPGDMPASAFEENILKDDLVKAYAEDVVHGVADLTKAIDGDWSKVPQPQIELMNRALSDKAVMRALPEKVRLPLQRFRDQITALKNLMKKAGVFSDDMIPVVDANEGIYLTRQFKVHTDPKWFDKVPAEVKNRFKTWFTEEARRAGYEYTPEEVDGVIEKLLKNDTAAENPIAFFANSKLGAKDLGILTRRKDLSPELLELLGEVKDPVANYAASIGRMANLYANHLFQTRIREIGLKEGWLSERAVPGLSSELAKSGEVSMGSLAGTHTTPEIKAAFEKAFRPEHVPQWMRSYMKALGVFKYSKTVLSPIAHVRQTIGNVMFNVANGHPISAKAISMMKEMYKGTKAGREYHRRLIELGIDQQSALGREFAEVVKDAIGAKNPFEFSTVLKGTKVTRWIGRRLDSLQKAYRYEDLYIKINAFESEKARYTKARPDWTPEQVESHASRIVQATFPTYSRIPGGIKWLRRFPLVGSFVSFSAEVVRTTYNTARIAAAEMKDANPEVRSIGYTRLAGLVTSLSAVAAMGMVTRILAGVSLEEEDALRRNLPPWSRDGQLIHLGRDSSGKYRVVNMGHTDPHSFLLEPLQAGLTGARAGTLDTLGLIEPLARPFISEEIGTRAVLDVARNTTEQQGKGGRVYNPQDSSLNKLRDSTAHILLAAEPGLVSQMLRTGRAASGVKNSKTGKEYSLGEELLADFTGQRMIVVDPRESLVFKARAFGNAVRESEGVVTAEVNRFKRSGVRPDAKLLEGVHADSEVMRRRVFDEMFEDVQSARLLGMTDAQIASALRDGGVARKDIGLILGGKYRERPVAESLRR